MTFSRGHISHGAECLVIVVVGVVIIHCESLAQRNVGGRFYLTYQETKTPGLSEEYLSEHFETVLKDKLFERNDLSLAAYLDNSKNLSREQTFRRYRFDFNLTHKYYSFGARVSPRQKLTPLETAESREFLENQATLNVSPPKLPSLRLYYSRRRQYADGAFTGYGRDLRGDLRYSFKFLDVGLNRWYAKNANGFVNRTTVTGGMVRFTQSYKTVITTNGGYDYQQTATTPPIGPQRKVTNHTLNGLLVGRYKTYATGTVSLSSRFLDSRNNSASDSRNEDFNFILALFPGYPLQVDLSRAYQSSRQQGSRTKTDYATVQAVAQGAIWPGTTGRVQVSQRFDIGTVGQPLPADIYSVSLRSRVYDGIDLRADVNVAKRLGDVPDVERYQSSSVLDLFLRPTKKLTIAPNLLYVKFSERVSFVHNDRAMYGVKANYFPENWLNMGLDLRYNEETKGERIRDKSAIFNLGLTLRSRSSVNVSYGRNDRRKLEGGAAGTPGEEVRGETLNVQAQTWVTRNSSLIGNYSSLDRKTGGDTSSLSVAFRLDF